MKRIISVILILVAILLTFSSCSSNKNLYTHTDGKVYIVARDDNGNIITNDNSKLLVYVLNENNKKQKNDAGEYITEYITFNGQVVSGSTVETAEMRFTLPKGFVAHDNVAGYFSLESKGGEMFISYKNDDIEGVVNATVNNCESLLESFGSEYFSYEKYELDCSGVKVSAVKHISTSPEYNRAVHFYYIPYDTGYYSISVGINSNHLKGFDFDKMIENIILKPTASKGATA